jgi:hypothetical protein
LDGADLQELIAVPLVIAAWASGIFILDRWVVKDDQTQRELPLWSHSCQFGRTSAPVVRHLVHTMRGPNDGAGASSDRGSALMIVLRPHDQQHTAKARPRSQASLPRPISLVDGSAAGIGCGHSLSQGCTRGNAFDLSPGFGWRFVPTVSLASALENRREMAPCTTEGWFVSLP